MKILLNGIFSNELPLTKDVRIRKRQKQEKFSPTNPIECIDYKILLQEGTSTCYLQIVVIKS